MNNPKLRTIIYFILMLVFMEISYAFMLHDYFNRFLEMLIFEICFLAANHFAYIHGARTREETIKEVYGDYLAKTKRENLYNCDRKNCPYCNYYVEQCKNRE